MLFADGPEGVCLACCGEIVLGQLVTVQTMVAAGVGDVEEGER